MKPMKKEIEELCRFSGASRRDMVEVIRELYPKYDKTMLSKCLGEGYGIALSADAMHSLYQRFAPELEPKDMHKWPRMTLRLSPKEYAALKDAAEENGQTLQYMAHCGVVAMLKGHRFLEDDNG